MIILLFATVKLIQSCEYYCETCDSLQNFCSSCPETRQITQGDTGLSECLCKQNFVDIGGQECLQCPSNCVNCDSLDPSKCISCGNKDYTHRILGNSNQCVCEEGYFEVWYSYNCQNIQFNLQILQFKYILSQQLYVKRLQDKYSCSQKTVQGLDYMIKRGVVDDGTNSFQFISKLQQNEISSTVAPYPLGQYYIQQFQNLFALGIKLNHEQVALWAANVNSNDYTMYQGKRVIYHNTWKFVIYQFQLSNYDGNIFLQIALSENGEVKPENKNRLLESQLGNMALLYYLAYEHNYFLNELELNEIINDILYIQFQKPQNSLDYYYDGQALIILKCQVNYVLKNEECVCDNENGYYIYNGICKLQCPNDCLTCTKEVCLMFNNQIRCQEGYYLESNNKICLKCNSTCQTCMNDKVCTKCRENLILSNEQCLTCSEFQKQFMCDQYDSNCICTKCIEGFQLDQFSKCIKCPINCISCNFEDKCINCKEGYYFNNNQCIQCQENCILCQDQNYCIKSNKGYYVQKGILLQCTNNCLAFQNECQCENCLAKYYQDENDKLCYSCPVQCQTCSNQSTCQSCVSNSFYLEDSHCKECKTPCLTCLNQSKCLTCINEQYYYIQGEQKCIQCPTPCYQCYYDQNPLCINCLENFYLFNQQCYACPIYCKGTCQFDVTNKFIQCEQCSIGFYPSQINLPFDCINCSNNCINCTTEQTCLQCSSGYILRNGQCLNCSQIYESTCLDCNEQRCQNCQNGYKLMNGKCIQDVINEIPICQVKRQFYNIIKLKIFNCYQCKRWRMSFIFKFQIKITYIYIYLYFSLFYFLNLFTNKK